MQSAIKLLDLSFQRPAENLACDQLILDHGETGQSPPCLRFWESPTPFVVLGYADRVSTEVLLQSCNRDQIPVLRRCSGGGAVLQGPGCLNYALALPISWHPALHSITGANHFIMETNRAAIESLLHAPVRVSGCTDLSINNLKFSGNAQRRRQTWLLFHGTFLLHRFNLDLLAQYLPPPSRQPAYRHQRTHAEFVTKLPLQPQTVQTALANAWRARELFPPPSTRQIQDLANSRYNQDSWNFKRP